MNPDKPQDGHQGPTPPHTVDRWEWTDTFGDVIRLTGYCDMAEAVHIDLVVAEDSLRIRDGDEWTEATSDGSLWSTDSEFAPRDDRDEGGA